MANRTTDQQPDAKTLRCPAVEGAQQCLAAKHGKMQNHRWGPKGETNQWHADGRPKDWGVPDPEAADRESTLVVGNSDVRPAVPPPDGRPATADPAPPTPGGGDPPASTTDTVPTPVPAGSGGGPGRPSDDDQLPAHRIEPATGIEGVQGPPRAISGRRSIGRVIANTAIDAALGVPADVQDERAHAREAVEILVEAAADHHRHHRPMPAERLLDLEAVVQHMVGARGLR